MGQRVVVAGIVVVIILLSGWTYRDGMELTAPEKKIPQSVSVAFPAESAVTAFDMRMGGRGNLTIRTDGVSESADMDSERSAGRMEVEENTTVAVRESVTESVRNERNGTFTNDNGNIRKEWEKTLFPSGEYGKNAHIGILITDDHYGGDEEYNFFSDDTGNSLTDLLERIGAEMGDPVFLRIFKEERLLEVWINVEGVYRLLTRYSLCDIPGEIGPKREAEDGQAPEGFYRVTWDGLNPESERYRAMGIDYPNRYDRLQGWEGTDVVIYGGCESSESFGLKIRDSDQLFELVESALDNGLAAVPVHIFPFRLADERLEEHSEDLWYDFWINLKEGYEIFEQIHRVPGVSVGEDVYLFTY